MAAATPLRARPVGDAHATRRPGPRFCLVSCICVAGTVLDLYLASMARSFGSDDVILSNALLTWRPFSGHVLYVATDNFLLKAPFLALGDLFPPGKWTLFVEASAFAALNMVLVCWAADRLIHRLGRDWDLYSALALIWASLIGFYVAQNLLNIIDRNVEIGVALVFLFYVFRVCAGEIDFSRPWRWAVFGLIVGLLTLNDPYFLYFTVLPTVVLVGCCLIGRWVPVRTGAQLAIGFALGAPVFLLSRALATAMGISIHESVAGLAPLSDLLSEVSVSIRSLLLNVNGDVADGGVLGLPGPLALVGFALVLIGMAAGLAALLGNWRKRPSSLRVLMAVICFNLVAMLAIYTVSSQVTGLPTYHYLIPAVFLLAVLFAIWIPTLGTAGRRSLGVLLAAAVAVNLGSSISMAATGLSTTEWGAIRTYEKDIPGNQQNYALVAQLESRHLDLGFSDYNSANITSYLSGDKVEVLPVLCVDEHTAPYYYGIDTGLYSQPARTSYYVFDSETDLYSAETCGAGSLVKQFGSPMSSFTVGGTYTVWVFNYDIDARMTQYPAVVG